MKYRIALSWINRKTNGTCDYEKKVITINQPLFLVTTFIHEMIHANYPDYSENKVLKLEQDIISKLPISKIKSLSRGILLFKGKRCVKIDMEFIKKGRLK